MDHGQFLLSASSPSVCGQSTIANGTNKRPQMMVMSLFAVFWLSFGLLQLPTLGLAAAYSATGNAAQGAASKEYNAVIAIYLIVWGFALFTFFIFTLKTNAVFAGIFFFVRTISHHSCDTFTNEIHRLSRIGHHRGLGIGWSIFQSQQWRICYSRPSSDGTFNFLASCFTASDIEYRREERFCLSWLR